MCSNVSLSHLMVTQQHYRGVLHLLQGLRAHPVREIDSSED